MNLNLTGKRVLVTGSTSGIGLAIARSFVNHESRVLINGRDEKAVVEQSEHLGCHGCVADVTDKSQVHELVSDTRKLLGGLDILICNVGSGRSVPPGEEQATEWQRMFELNLFSTTNLVGELKPMLAESKGSIVCISSICGMEVVPNAPVTYSASKAALGAYVAGIARPLGKLGIRINAVAPGNVMFEGSVWEYKLSRDQAATNEMLSREVSLSRFASLTEVSDAVVFLASDASSFTTGQILAVDGGQVRGR